MAENTRIINEIQKDEFTCNFTGIGVKNPKQLVHYKRALEDKLKQPSNDLSSLLPLKLTCSIQIGSSVIQSNEKLHFTENAIRINFERIGMEPLMIPNCGILEIGMFSEDNDNFLVFNTTENTYESVRYDFT